jgi:hypothetical protein
MEVVPKLLSLVQTDIHDPSNDDYAVDPSIYNSLLEIARLSLNQVVRRLHDMSRRVVERS